MYVGGYVKNFTGFPVDNYTDLAKRWLCEKRFETLKCIYAGVAWSIWMTRNDFVFRG
jgi:hypothetical protein